MTCIFVAVREWRIVDLAQHQWADEPHIAEALKQCKEGWWDRPSFIYFPEFYYLQNETIPWFKYNSYFMRYETKGIILLEMLRNGSIGGFSFWRRRNVWRFKNTAFQIGSHFSITSSPIPADLFVTCISTPLNDDERDAPERENL